MLGWLSSLFYWRKRESVAGDPAPARIERIILSDGVARTLFDDYAEHRRSARGDEEIGWVLMGMRQGRDVIALAALPAGAERDAGVAHVRFNASAQALASRLIRKTDKRLQIIGVVHTHPGSLRTPSGGDFDGDIRWVAKLRGGEGVFAIGTADIHAGEAKGTHVQTAGELCFCWYALAVGDSRYRPLPAQVTNGPDLAFTVRSIWNTIEIHADAIDHLCRQFANVDVDVMADDPEPLMLVRIGLPEPFQQLRLLLSSSESRYYWASGNDVTAIDPHEANLVRAVHLILAEMAKDAAWRETGTLVAK